jgi:hypothetical protein
MYRTASHYGWKPDLPDQRDRKYAAPKTQQLPSKVDLSSQCPPVYDQGQLGSCSANAIGGAFQFELMRQKAPDFVPSRLFIYYNERSIENTIDKDSGAQIRDGIKSVANLGVCPETSWPYVVSEFAVKPFAVCYTDALKHTAVSYERIAQQLDQMRGCLADGFPFVAGFTVYSSFEGPVVAKNGILGMPQASESVVGGHAVLVVGYDDAAKTFLVRNSWGPNWGQAGYFTMPYDYLTNENLASDFWTIRVVANNPAVQQTPGGRGQVSTFLPSLTAKLSQPVTVHVKIDFTGGTPNGLTMTLNDGSPQTITTSGTFSYDNVNSNDTIAINGTANASTKITIDQPTTPATPDNFNPGSVFGNYVIN